MAAVPAPAPVARDGESKGQESPEGQEAKKTEAADHLTLKVKSQDGNEVAFKVRRTAKFKKMMTIYCAKVGADIDAVRFLFDGARLRQEQTPAELEMEDEDEIDALVAQTGGK
jgi:small ubiquitin-related modifier